MECLRTLNRLRKHGPLEWAAAFAGGILMAARGDLEALPLGRADAAEGPPDAAGPVPPPFSQIQRYTGLAAEGSQGPATAAPPYAALAASQVIKLAISIQEPQTFSILF